MPSLIKTSLITYTVDVPEMDIRQALTMEAAEKHGLLHDGKLIPGVTVDVSYDGRRGSRNAGYRITLTRDPAKSGQALLPKGGTE
jgi:hypothetical protein